MATNAAPDGRPDAARTPPGVSPDAPAKVDAFALVPAGGRPSRRLSEELAHIIACLATRDVTLREVIVVLEGRAYNLLMLLLALPFLLPIPVPGLSTVLGAVIAIIAARLALGQKPWLPDRLLDRKLPAKFFPSLLGGARRVLHLLEVMLRPRLRWLVGSPLLIRLHACVIFIAAFVLLLPLPPGTNFPPALCIVIMAAGLLERDGVFILAGYVALALNAVFFTYFALYGHRLIQSLWHWIDGLWARL